MKSLALIILLLPVLSYSKAVKKKYISTQAQQAAKSLRLPAEVISKLESHYISEFKKQNPDQAAVMKDADIILKMKRKAMKANVRFEPIDSPVLAGNLRFDMPLGGGEILLSEHVRSQYPGRFQVFFDVEPISKDDVVKESFNSSLNVLYISQGQKRKVKGRDLGSGCGVYYDLSNSYKNVLSQQGITVDVMDASHVSALGGYFVFSFVHEDHLNLAIIKFSDNQYSQYLCS